MHRPKRWTIAEPRPADATELASRIGTSPLVAQVLLNRGMIDVQQCLDFLKPNLKCLYEPSLIPNLNHAAERIAKAVRDREKIVIYGDYDVDGITATAILWHAIRRLGGDAHYYIPHRIDEGYGLNTQAIEQICNEGAKLIVTVDCGVTAIEPARVARERGVDLIISDHHEFHEQLPDCYAVVHPRLPIADAREYANPYLCGAGVAFKLAWGVGQACTGAARVSEDFRAYLIDATALAALGTIADVVPLVGENRILAHFGLSGLRSSKLAGLKALIASAGLENQKLDSYHVGFLLAPRLNACGRMGHAQLAVEMLTSADEARALEIATYLESQNRQRQTIERQILDQALAQAEELKFDRDECRGIVLGADGWHPGVIGIVASRIVDRFHRPTIMVALNNGTGQGSGRSISGFHLAKALSECGQHLEAFGGHEMAAGLKLKTSSFADFREAFCHYAAQMIAPEQLVPELTIDGLAQLPHVTQSLVTDLKRLGPFGHGNRKPVLCCKQVALAGPPRRVGKTGDHLQLWIKQGNTTMKAIAFGLGRGDLCEQLKPGTTIDLAVEPQINEYNGNVYVELEVKDLQLAP